MYKLNRVRIIKEKVAKYTDKDVIYKGKVSISTQINGRYTIFYLEIVRKKHNLAIPIPITMMTYNFDRIFKAKGIDIIRNDSLKGQINSVYNFHIKSLMEDMVLWEWSYNQNTTQRMMVGNIRRDNQNKIAKPNDFERLKQDEEFRNFLSILIAVRGDNIDYTKGTQEAVEGLIAHIEAELKSRE